MLTHLLLLAQLAAFPGASGGGALSVGGRGGAVMEVTNLNDSGPGSRRACVQASGPRHCIYRVAGLIPVTSGDVYAGNPFLSDDCQTAPGEIILGGPKTNGALLRITTHDVIIRGCVFSPDNASVPSGPDTGTVGITIVNCPGVSPIVSQNAGAGCYNIMIDSVTTRWSGNKSEITTSNFTPGLNGNGNGDGPNHAITVQRSLDLEPAQGHPVGYGTATDETCVGTRANGNCLSPWETDIDYHHNIFVNVHHRIPENSNGSTRWINNIIYNWGYYANEWLGAEIIDTRNNKYAPGNLNSGAQKYPIHFTTNSQEMSGAPSVFVSGNVLGGYGANTPASDQYGTLVNQITGENGNETGPIPDAWKRAGPMPDTPIPIVVEPVASLDADLVSNVGAWWHLDCLGNRVSHQDPQDARILAQYKNNASGGYWPNGVTYTGQPTIPTPLPNWTDTPVVNGTACVESLHDGLPDQWKVANGYSTTDVNLHNKVLASGYTVLETYLAGSGATPPPVNPVSPNGTTVSPASGGTITDAAGNAWTLGAVVPISSQNCNGVPCGNVIVKNGAAINGTAATLLLWYNNALYQENSLNLWWQWNGSNFVKVGGDPRPPVNPVVTSVVPSCPSPIAATATSQCTVVVQGTGNFSSAVTWTATNGTVSAAGLYTPAVGTTTFVGVVTATSVQTPSVSGNATVTITSTPPVCPALPVKVAVTVGGVAVGSMTCQPNAANTGYTCSLP
jgi:hypothetical protein